MTDTTLEREAMLAGRIRSTNVRRFQYFADWELRAIAASLGNTPANRGREDLYQEAVKELRDRKATTY